MVIFPSCLQGTRLWQFLLLAGGTNGLEIEDFFLGGSEFADMVSDEKVQTKDIPL